MLLEHHCAGRLQSYTSLSTEYFSSFHVDFKAGFQRNGKGTVFHRFVSVHTRGGGGVPHPVQWRVPHQNGRVVPHPARLGVVVQPFQHRGYPLFQDGAYPPPQNQDGWGTPLSGWMGVHPFGWIWCPGWTRWDPPVMLEGTPPIWFVRGYPLSGWMKILPPPRFFWKV